MNRKNQHRSTIQKYTKRFISPKVSGTGIDPNGVFIEFTKKDIRQNIDMHRDNFKREENLESMKDRISVGCTKKIQVTRSETPPVTYDIKTDHITIQKPAGGHSMPYSQSYSKATTTKNGWVAPSSRHSLSNCHSTNYNILNFQEIPYAAARNAKSTWAGRSKGITEFSDLNRPFNPHFNEDYQQAIRENSKIFYKKTGIFSHMYDASARHGFMIKPFEKSAQNDGRPAFK